MKISAPAFIMDDIGVLLMMTMMKICFVIINHFSECHNKQLTPFGDNDYTNDDDDEYDPGDFDNYDNDVDAHSPPWRGKASAVQAPCSCASK